jgi:hypothetical protein
VTLATRLISASPKDSRYAVTIDGIPCEFTAAIDEAAPTVTGATDGRGMLVSVDESGTKLDRQKRIQTGGGFVAVVQDRAGLLDGLFAVRSFRSTFIRTNTTRIATTVNVSSTASLPSAGVVYVGGETIAYTGKTANTLTGCTRGAFGSPAQPHRGGTDNGASVYTVPPGWMGRRVRLTIVFRDDAGVIDVGTRETLGTFRLEAAPVSLGEDRWELRCSHLSDEIGRRKLGTGIAEIKTPGTRVVMIDGGAFGRLLRLTTIHGVAESLTQGTLGTHLLVSTTGRGKTIFKIKSVTAGAVVDTIDLYPTALTDAGRLLVSDAFFVFETGGNSAALDRIQVEWVKHIAILGTSTPSVSMLNALESRTGDGSAGTFDVLPGVEPTTLGGPGFRFGSAMPTAEIDVGSLVATTVPQGWSWVIDEELPLGDLLRDYCRDTNTAAIYTPTGQLSFVPMVEDASSSAATIAEAHIMGAVQATIAEDSIYGRARIECNYDPIDGEYEGTVDIIDEDIASTYAPAEGSLVVRSRSLMVDPIDQGGDGSLVRGTTSIDEVLPSLRRTMVDSRGGTLVLTLTADGRHLTLPLGSLIDLSLPSVPDFRGGTLAAGRARVVERDPDWQSMTVRLTLIVEEVLWYFAPFGIVASVVAPVGANQTITLTSDPYAPDGTSAFRTTDQAHVLADADGTLVGAGVSVVSITSPTVFVVTDLDPVNPSLPLVAGQAIVYASTLSSGTSSAAGLGGKDYAHMDGENVSSALLTRWR